MTSLHRFTDEPPSHDDAATDCRARDRAWLVAMMAVGLASTSPAAWARPLGAPLQTAHPASSLPGWLPAAMLLAGLALLAAVLLTAKHQTGLRTTFQALVQRLRAAAPTAAGGKGGSGVGGRHRIAHAANAELLATTENAEQRILALTRDLEELAQRLAIDADARAGRLEELVARADERLARLEHSAPLPPLYAASRTETPTDDPAAASRQSRKVRGDLDVIVRPMGVPGYATLAPVASQGPVPAPAAVAHRPSMARESSDSTETLLSQVYRMADDGFATPEIAQRLRQHAGKVELILALRPKR